MSHTTIPTSKGQITIPAIIRRKYKIDVNTPLQIDDCGDGNLSIKVMRMVADDEAIFYENDEMVGIHFKHGIDPKILIKKLKEIDG